MASGWSVVRDELNTALETLDLVRAERGIADFAGQPEPGAGYALFENGYFVVPNSMIKGDVMQTRSRQRFMFCEIYTGISIGADFDVASDALAERVELILQLTHDTSANIPSARIAELSGPVQFQFDQQSFEQMYARIPLRIEYEMSS